MNAKQSFLILLVAFCSVAFSSKGQEQIKWYTVEEAFEAGEKEQRKFFIDVYTHWCGPCRQMDATTFRHPAIIKTLNKYYYPVKFNAETKDSVLFMDSVFVTKYGEGKRGPHEFAKFIVNGPKMVYPSLVFMNERATWMQVIQSALSPGQFEQVINYFAQIKLGQENITYEEFLKDFVPEVKPITPAPTATQPKPKLKQNNKE